jgi:zona occludens toxin
MGSGKSFEVVSNVIVPALGRGRRVISNIAGLEFEVIKSYLMDEKKIPEDQIGQLISVSHDAITDPQFWLTDKDDLSTRGELLMRPGDLVCLDEIWRFFEGFKRPPERVLNFVRMHRHMLDENGVSSDLALVTQDIMDIGPPVRRVIEETFRMTKLTMVGAPKKYRIDVYSGAQGRDDKPLRSFFRSYDSKFFPMYSSHSLKKQGQQATEENIDDRGNILKHPGIRYGIPAGVVLFGFCIWFGISSFTDMATQTGVPQKPEIADHQKSTPSATGQHAEKQSVPSPLQQGTIRAYISSPAGVSIITDQHVLQNPPALKITPLSVEAFSPDGRLYTTEVRKNVSKVDRGFMDGARSSTGPK